jgi:cysteine synthase
MAKKITDSILDLVGQTPHVRLTKLPSDGSAGVIAKLEYFNPAGSVKDRICISMIQGAEERGLLKRGTVVVEPTSGNTGIGLAMICAVKGYQLILTMPESMSEERISILKSYGAEVVLTPADEGMVGAVKRAEEIMARKKDAYMPQQFKNPDNPKVHRQTTAREILDATQGKLDAFVAGVGTGGTVTGCGEVLKKKIPGIKIIAVEPTNSAVLSGQPPGGHRIQGIGAGFVPPVLNRSVIDECRQVTDEDAFKTAKSLAQEEGLYVGISSGAACWVALKVSKELGPSKQVLVIFPDSGERYASLEKYLS